MNYSQAQIAVRNNQHLIGTINEKGFEVSDIIIVPSNPILRDQFIRHFLMSKDAIKSIQHFIDADVEVWGIDTKHLFMANILFYKVIEQ